MRIFDKTTDKEYAVMQYKFRATDEFFDFVGVKSFREENFTTSAIVDGVNKVDNHKKITFTFDGYDKEITMEDGYWFGKNSNGDWKIFSNETIENEDGITVIDEEEISAEEVMMDKLMTSRDDFMFVSLNLVDLIKANLWDYANICLIDEDVDIYEETKELCEKLKNNLKHLAEIKDDEDYEINDEEDICVKHPELYSKEPFDDPIVKVYDTGEVKEYKSPYDIAKEGICPEIVIEEANRNKK